MSSPRTICAIRCDDGAQRLHHLMTEGRDPGTPNRSGAMTPNDRMTPSELHAEFLAALNDLVVEYSDLGVKPLELKMEGSLPYGFACTCTTRPGRLEDVLLASTRSSPLCRIRSEDSEATSTSRTAEQCSSSATRLRTPCSSSGTLAPTETFPILGTCRSSRDNPGRLRPRDRTARAKAATGGRDDGARDGRSSDRRTSRRGHRQASRSVPQASPGELN